MKSLLAIVILSLCGCSRFPDPTPNNLPPNFADVTVILGSANFASWDMLVKTDDGKLYGKNCRYFLAPVNARIKIDLNKWTLQ